MLARDPPGHNERSSEHGDSLPDPGPPNLDFERPASRARLERTAAALAARGFNSRGNVILVIGAQKLVRDLDEGLRRLREYSLPREFAGMQGVGHPGSLLAKTLIIHYEPSGRIDVILVPEALGF